MRFACLFLLALPAAAAPLDGFWQSEGYGYVLEIRGTLLNTFEITRSTCVHGFTARRRSGAEDVFRSKKQGAFFIRPAGDDDHKLLHQEETVTDIRLHRIANRPAVCDTLTPDTPLSNFDVFTRTFDEHYIGFDSRHVDWERAIAENRPRVTPATTAPELYDILEGMLRPLGDLHTGIEATALKRSTKPFWRPGSDRLIGGDVNRFADHGRWTLFALTNRKYLQAPPRMLCRKHLQYGHLDEGAGYLRILSFGGYARHGDLAALEAALDRIFADRGLTSLIIDVRLSFGGSDELGVAIANRLATSEYLAYSIQARSDAADRAQWTPAHPVVIRPRGRPGFRGPVAILTGPVTMSGAETFVQALMGRPGVTRVGESTQGVFCDALERHLPNGWTFELPNAVYRTADGRAFDVTGLPPDIEVPVFAAADVAAGRDTALEAARKAIVRTR